jgi:hypothetical protein
MSDEALRCVDHQMKERSLSAQWAGTLLFRLPFRFVPHSQHMVQVGGQHELSQQAGIAAA